MSDDPTEHVVLVTGSRAWTDSDAVREALTIEHAAAWWDATNPVLIHGACPSGADWIADRIAREPEWSPPWDVRPHPAAWDAPCRPTCTPGHRRPSRPDTGTTYCPAAGQYRNQDMVDLRPDVVRAFYAGPSRGTRGCVAAARAAGLTIYEWTEDGHLPHPQPTRTHPTPTT